MAAALLALSMGAAIAMEAPRQLDDLPPALAEVIREARAQAEHLAGETADAASRADAWGHLAMLYHTHRLRYLAQASYQRALAEVDDPRWRYLHGVALSELGEIERAAADFRTVTRATPDSLAAWYRLGVALLLSGDVDGAQEALEAARKRDPRSALVLAALADVAAAREDHRAALGFLEQAWALEPQAGQLAYKLAVAHRALGDRTAAAAWLARQPDNSLAPTIDDPLLLEVAQMSRSARFYEIAADWALGRGDLAAAADALQSASALAPEDVGLALRLAFVLGESGRRDDALAAARRAIALEPRSAAAWYRLAWLLRTSDETADRATAEEAIRKSLAHRDDAAARALAAAFAMRSRQFDVAASHYARLAEVRPDDAYAHHWLGMARLGEADCTAPAAFAEALRLRPNWGEAHIALARTDALCGNGAAAAQRATALLEAKDDIDTRLTRAFAELAVGKADLARQLAMAEMPHPDAALLVEAHADARMPTTPFAPQSAWWLPPEVRPTKEPSRQ